MGAERNFDLRLRMDGEGLFVIRYRVESAELYR